MNIFILHVVLLLSILAVQQAASVRGHGYLKLPPARNVLANSDYCPHCLNGGTVATVSAGGTLVWPSGLHGICGDPFTAPKPRPHEVGGKFYSASVSGSSGVAAPVVSYQEGQMVRFEVTVTTNHNGRFMFSICKVNGATHQDEEEQLTQDCLNEHVLKQANVPGAQNPGDQWFYTTPGDPMYNEYTMFYQLPDLLTCDGVDSRCILQFYWVSGNSCNPPNTPDMYKRPFGLPDCGSQGAAYPEEFWNCADIKIIPSGWKSFYPETTQGIAKQVRSSLSVYHEGKTIQEQAAATLFCTTKVNAYGMFPDVAHKCRGYFICQELASYYVHCPSGTTFDAVTRVCQYEDRAICTDLRPLIDQ